MLLSSLLHASTCAHAYIYVQARGYPSVEDALTQKMVKTLHVSSPSSGTGMPLSEGIALGLGTPTIESPSLLHQVFIDLMSNTPDSVFLKDKIGAVVVKFIADNDKFLAEYAKAFTYMITADLFYAPSANACQDMDIPTLVRSFIIIRN